MFRAGAYSGTKGMQIRPTDQLLAVFSMHLNTYDLVAGLDQRITWKPTRVKGRDAARVAARPVSDEELCALALWTSRGGLARLRNAEYLGAQLQAYHSTYQWHP